MQTFKKIILPVMVISLAFTFFAYAKAQDIVGSDLEAQILTEEQILSEDLEIEEPSLLPDSPFYFIKDWSRIIRLAFIFDETKKTELESKFSSELLLELRKMAENGKNPEAINKATEKYQNAISRTKERADRIKGNTEENEQLNTFLEKFANHQIIHQRVLEKLEGKVPEEALEKIKEARERHIEKFGEVMQRLEKNNERIAEKIENALENGKLENERIADRIKEKMPEDVRVKINARVQKRNNQQVACTMEYAPVCGTDGKTYGNKCAAEVAGAQILRNGECETEPIND